MCLWKPPRRFFIACFPNILASFVFEVRHRIGFDGTQGRQVLGQSKPRASLSSVDHMLARNDALPGQDERSQATKVEQISIIYLVLGPFQIHHDPSLGSLGTLFIFSCSQKLRLETAQELSGQCYSNQNQGHRPHDAKVQVPFVLLCYFFERRFIVCSKVLIFK